MRLPSCECSNGFFKPRIKNPTTERKKRKWKRELERYPNHCRTCIHATYVIDGMKVSYKFAERAYCNVDGSEIIGRPQKKKYSDEELKRRRLLALDRTKSKKLRKTEFVLIYPKN